MCCRSLPFAWPRDPEQLSSLIREHEKAWQGSRGSPEESTDWGAGIVQPL